MGHNTCKSMGRVLCVVRRYELTTVRKRESLSVSFITYRHHLLIAARSETNVGQRPM